MSSYITLLDSSTIKSTVSKVAEVFNKHFVNTADFLAIINIHEREPLNDRMGDNSLAIVERFGTHPSIIKIK